MKPCPFCGSTQLRSGTRDGVGYVDCNACHVTVDFYGENRPDGQTARKNDAEERWNKRV